MTQTTPTIDAAEPPPDWSALPDSVPCPLCSYNLRGLAEPRCPECGYAFTWPALFEARRTVHRYLFEHHPERNVRSFVRTSLATLLPRRFWRSVSAAHPIRVRRLVLYWFLASLPLLTILTAGVALDAWLYRERIALQARQALAYYQSLTPSSPGYDVFAPEVLKKYGSFKAFVDQNFHPPAFHDCFNAAWRDYQPIALACGLWLLWPFATAAALLAYRHSMRHAAIRPAHVFRCVLYSADLIFWPAFLALVWLAWSWGSFVWDNVRTGAPPLGSWPYLPRHTINWVIVAWHVIVLLAIYRVTVAYSRYLRFDKAWLAVPLASAASLLFLWILYLAMSNPEGIWRLPL